MRIRELNAPGRISGHEQSIYQRGAMTDPKKPPQEEQEDVLDEPWDHPDREPDKHPDLEKLRESEE